MVETTTKNEGEGVKTEVVEKRIKPTVIRRRKKEVKPVEEEIKAEAASGEAEISAEKQTEEKVEAGSETSEKWENKEDKGPAKPKEEKKLPLKIIAQPEEVEEETGEKPVSSAVIEQAPKAQDRDLDRFIKKAAKKKKSKAELQYEDIRKQGGLMQFARTVTTDEPSVTPETRVFRPTLRGRKKKPVKKSYKRTQITEKKAIKKIIKVSETISVSDLSQAMGVKASDIIKRLMDLGVMATVNQAVESDTASLIATEHGYEVESVAFNEESILNSPKEEALKGDMKSRPPVVTVMGHVDHGKTSILDVIRKANVAEGEAGGITQHVGAYTVKQNDKNITFVDTPGHEAFTHMRARGAQVTDLIILVVAADDGVMPQTKEAIDHARAAGVPIIVAINKIDKPNANLDKVKRELSEAELLPEDWGGETICVPTSAKTKEGIDQLLEMVLLQAEILELKAVYDGRAMGIVIESKMDKRRGPLVTCVIKEGTLRQGDAIVAGTAWGKARSLLNDKGKSVKEALPAQPVEILGLSEVPEAGEHLTVVEDEKAAKVVSENRRQKSREESLARKSKVTLEDLKSQLEGGETKDLNVIVKTDVKGVSDAIKDSLPGLSTKEVKIKVLHTGVGGITEGDILLASASNAVVLGFNVVADPSSRELAEREGVEIKTYSIIYEMLEDIKKAIAGMLTPKEVEKFLGRAVVRDTFKVPKVGVIAGCQVTNGKILRSANIRLLRENVIIHDGKISSLKRFKDDVKEVPNGMECGIGIERFQDVKEGDEIEAYAIEKIKTTWEELREQESE